MWCGLYSYAWSFLLWSTDQQQHKLTDLIWLHKYKVIPPQGELLILN